MLYFLPVSVVSIFHRIGNVSPKQKTSRAQFRQNNRKRVAPPKKMWNRAGWDGIALEHIAWPHHLFPTRSSMLECNRSANLFSCHSLTRRWVHRHQLFETKRLASSLPPSIFIILPVFPLRSHPSTPSSFPMSLLPPCAGWRTGTGRKEASK